MKDIPGTKDNKGLRTQIQNFLKTLQLTLLSGRVGEWPSGLWHCKRILMFSVQTPTDTEPGLGTKPRYKVPREFRVEN